MECDASLERATALRTQLLAASSSSRACHTLLSCNPALTRFALVLPVTCPCRRRRVLPDYVTVVWEGSCNLRPHHLHAVPPAGGTPLFHNPSYLVRFLRGCSSQSGPPLSRLPATQSVLDSPVCHVSCPLDPPHWPSLYPPGLTHSTGLAASAHTTPPYESWPYDTADWRHATSATLPSRKAAKVRHVLDTVSRAHAREVISREGPTTVWGGEGRGYQGGRVRCAGRCAMQRRRVLGW